MHGARTQMASQNARFSAAWRAHFCAVGACIIDRSFVVIRLKHLAV